MTSPRARIEIIETKQKFLLDHELISIGRATDNTLILGGCDVSRHHAHLAWNLDGYVITDLGSSSGTGVNAGILPPRVPRRLFNGDIIRIGATKLHFFTEVSASWQNSTEVEPYSSWESTVVSLNSTTPVLCVTTPHWTQQFSLDKDNLTLGRDLGSDILIDAQVVSSKHAQLRRVGDSYDIIDLGSKNGLTFKGNRINQKRLSDGDVIYIGSSIVLIYQITPLITESVPIEILNLRECTTLRIGRNPQNDTVINHPSVSNFHARIERKNGSLIITDLKSTNGTFVNGKQITSERVLRPNDTIRIGPCRLVFNFDETIVRHNEEGNLRLDAVNLSKVVGKGTTLLSNISLSILAKEFVAIAGVSGGGKSTLLDALNGFRPATSGSVLVNGTDLYKNFNAYRTELGYVPQKDIVHTELTVSQALGYAAQLRMPADTTLAECNE